MCGWEGVWYFWMWSAFRSGFYDDLWGSICFAVTVTCYVQEERDLCRIDT